MTLEVFALKRFCLILLSTTVALNCSLSLSVIAQTLSKQTADLPSNQVAYRFPGAGESNDVAEWLLQLKQQVQSSGSTVSPVLAPAANSNTKHLRDRIAVVPPLLDHPPVSPITVEAVRRAIDKLPAPIYDLLDKSGATITLAPNIIDKWPDAGDLAKPFVQDQTLGEEPGRTYGRDLYLYEREKVRGSTQLKEAQSPEFVVSILYQLLGHALDDVLGLPSNDPAFREALANDKENMTSAERESLSYFLVPMECFAECAGSAIGGRKGTARHFPQASAWVRRKLSLEN